MVVGEILRNIAEAILEKLRTLVLEEIQLSLSFRDDLERFHSTLSTISAVLLDAEERQQQSHAVRDWLRKLKDTLYDAQDVLDDLTAEALSQKVEPQWAIVTQVRNLFFCSEMGRRVMDIRKKLDAIAEERRNFHFKEQVDNVQPIARRENTYSFVRDTEIVGRENDKRVVIELLFDNGNENLSIVPIVGMGGLGKTTLAKLVFNDAGIEGCFDLEVWVSVSDDLNAKKIVEKIIRAASGSNIDHLDMENMHILLLRILNEKKFLIVLDDVWKGNHAEWIELKDLLGNETKGSKIVVTTRDRYTASIMGSDGFYNLAGLPHDDCWSLFEKWAFREGESARHPSLAEIGQEIVRKCGGVPLAICTLGSLLYLNTKESYWLDLVNSESWDIAQREGGILPVLKLSYDQLPPHLKECFAYCSILPKAQEFDKETLIQLWMAQGFIHSSNRCQQLEDVGSLYFDELVSRSLFDVVRENNKGKIVKCRIHDLLHDLAISVMGTECFTLHSHTTTMLENIRHLSFWGFYFQQNARPLIKITKLRTLLLPAKMGNYSENFLGALVSASKYLRVLDLSYLGIKTLPSYIGGMKHLRCLNLNGNHDLKYLPDSICKLHSLQTLKLLGTQINTFPRKLGNLISLRHLIINSPLMRTWEEQLGSLTPLYSLAIVHCHNLISLSEAMRHLTALRTLRIHNCSRLTSLPRNMEHNAIENLEIVNCPRLSFPGECMQSFSNLRSLTINGLPQLATLTYKLECSAGTLQYLFIIDCLNLMTLPECLGNLSSLKRIDIICCPNLLNLPYTFRSLAALQVVQIDRCPLLSTRCRRDVGEDWPKIAHVPQIYVDRMKI